MLDEDDMANNLCDELKEQGFKSFEDRERHRQFKRALQDYEHKLACPYDY